MELKARLKQQFHNFTLDIDLTTRSLRLGILGASGAGKSMTLKMLAGIVSPKEGIITLDGRVLLDTHNRINVRPQKRRIGYLFQNYALFPSMTVEENIGAGIARHSPDKKKIVEEMIGRFHLTGLEKQVPAELSGGQQQRVALARILASSPDMILLDEPFSALDVHLKDRMQRELLIQLSDYPGPVFMVSHSRDEIYRFSDEILIVDKGRIIAQGPKKEVFARPATREAAALTGCKNFSWVTRIDDHTFHADSWGVTIRTEKVLPKEMDSIGYRAHEFIPVWGEAEENCIPFLLERKDELPFEENYYVRPNRTGYEPEDVISWFVQREQGDVIARQGLPDYLKMNEKEILIFNP